MKRIVGYTEVCPPVSKQITLRALLFVVAAADLELHHLDVKTTFLNGKLEEDIYMVYPRCYESGTHLVCELHKSLYGLKQASRTWYTCLKQEMELLGFNASAADLGQFIRSSGLTVSYVRVHVDDMLVSVTDVPALDDVQHVLKCIFDVHNMGNSWVWRFIVTPLCIVCNRLRKVY